MELVTGVLALIWVLGTPLVSVAAFAFAVYVLLDNRRSILRRIGPALAAVVVSFVLWVGNPVLNLFTFMPVAQGYLDRMLADAKAANCVGKTTEWLQERYGRPFQVERDERDATVEYWSYTPGPWFIIHEDYVGFTVTNGVVTKAYMQVS